MILLLAFCAGAATALVPLPNLIFLSAAGILLLFAAMLLLIKRERRLTLIFLGLCFGLLFSTVYQMVFLSPARALAGQQLTLSGTAVDYSQSSSHGLWVETKFETGSGTVRADVYLSDPSLALRPGDRLTGTFSLKSSAEDSDYYSFSEGIFLTAFGKKNVTVTPCQAVPLRYAPRQIAHQLEAVISVCFPQDVQGYAKALTTGNRSELTTLQKANLKASGIYHALALSGMHMSVLVGMLSLVLKKRRWRALIGIPVCILFAVITGGQPSIVRACVMQCLLLLADAVRRESDWPTSLSAALFLLVLQNPWCLTNWGLQLSFLSVIGICSFSDRSQTLLTAEKQYRGLQKVRRFIANAFSVTFSAMAATFPLMLLYFGCISLVSPVTNLLTGTVIMICFGGSLMTALIGLILPGLGSIMGWVITWGFRYADFVAASLARLPFSALYTDSFYSILCLILVYGALLFLLFGTRKIVPICCCVSGFSLCILIILIIGASPAFTALDVGQGQCLIFSSAGCTAIVDCGGNGGNAGDKAAEYCISHGIRGIDLLILTHFDSDHVGGVTELMARLPIRNLLYPDVDAEIRSEIEAAAAQYGVTQTAVSADMLANTRDISLQIFAPVDEGNNNDACLSILAQLHSFSVLATGDMDMDAEQRLMKTHGSLAATILVAGHHGSKYSTSAALLEETAPQIVVISVGENLYGHPTEEALARIRASGAEIRRTDEQGNLTFREGLLWQR